MQSEWACDCGRLVLVRVPPFRRYYTPVSQRAQSPSRGWGPSAVADLAGEFAPGGPLAGRAGAAPGARACVFGPSWYNRAMA
jgi:hypothetical protein